MYVKTGQSICPIAIVSCKSPRRICIPWMLRNSHASGML